MAAELDVIIGETVEDFEERLDSWTEDLKPLTAPEQFLVLTAVRASVRLDRCAAAETAALDLHVLAVTEDHEDRQAEEVAKLCAEFHEDPHGKLHKLLQTTQGCRWLHSQWYAIILRLAERSWLEPRHRRQAIYLWGKSPVLNFTDESVVAWHRLYIATLLGNTNVDLDRVLAIFRTDCPPTLHKSEYQRLLEAMIVELPDKEKAQDTLYDMINAELAALEDRIKILEAREKRNLKIKVRDARCDKSDDGALRHRYTTANERSLKSNLAALQSMQAHRRANSEQDQPPPQPPPATVAPAEPAVTPPAPPPAAAPPGAAAPIPDDPRPVPAPPEPTVACSSETIETINPAAPPAAEPLPCTESREPEIKRKI